jgi:mono/diheme cytochrome c family protein
MISQPKKFLINGKQTMTNQRKTFAKRIMLLLAMAVLLLPSAVLAAKPDGVKKDLLDKGKKIYFKRCVWCHGVEGGGDGPAAERLFTRPRNFIQGTFKIRTTDSGQLPLESDLVQTVKNGLTGSAMPPWGEVLNDDEVVAVVNFVKTLVQDRNFDDADEEVQVQEVGPMPWKTSSGKSEGYNQYLGVPQDAIEAGKQIFQKNKCWECHGGEGRGDGNPTMKDDWGFPIVAADWQQCWNFRGARRDFYNPFNIVRTISTGLNGTPMPNFREQITVEDRWKLAAFVSSLCPRKKIDKLTNKPVPDFLISSLYTPGTVVPKIDDPSWKAPDDDPKLVARPEGYDGTMNKKHYIAMAGQITRGDRNFRPRVDNLWVSSRWSPDEKAVYFLVEYHNRFLSQDAKFPDGVAMQWPAKLQDLYGAEKPYFIYGDAKKPVDVWKAQFMAKDYIPTNAPKPEGYQLDMKVVELNGNGFDKVVEKKTPTTVQVVDSVFKQGRVKVLYKRTLETGNKDTDVQIPTEKFIPVSFMEWSGFNKEINEHMAISTWYYTILEPPVPDSIYYLPPILAVAFLGFEGWLVWMTRRTRAMYSNGKAY